MKSTTDYSIFKEFSSNREVDPRHVNKLVAAIKHKNLLSVNPIIIDGSMRVIDGQHRLEAARALGIEIFYVEGEVNRNDISILNSNQKNWTAMDYINHYTIEKVSSFLQLSSLINNHPLMAVSALLTLSNSEGRRDIIQLKNGYLDVLGMDHAKEVCSACEDLFKRFDCCFVFDSRFPLAMSKAIQADNFNIERLVEQIDSNPRAFVQCHTKKQYMEMIQEIYNRNLSKNKISLD